MRRRRGVAPCAKTNKFIRGRMSCGWRRSSIMKKMLKAAAVLAAILMAFTLGACDDGSSSGSGGGGDIDGNGGGTNNNKPVDPNAPKSDYLKMEKNDFRGYYEVVGVYSSKIPSDGAIVIPDGVEVYSLLWDYDTGEQEFLESVDKIKSISLPAIMTSNSFGNVIAYSWVTGGFAENIDIIYRGTLSQWCEHGCTEGSLPNAKSIKVDNGTTDLKTLTDLVIPDGVEKINDTAFWMLPNIKSVTIPASVKEIDRTAFGINLDDGYPEDTKIAVVNYKGTLGQWCEMDIYEETLVPRPESIKMSDGTDLKTLTEITADDIAGAKRIGYQAFMGCSRLKSFEIPESVTEISEWAFADCSSLTSLTFKATDGWYYTKDFTGEAVDVTDAQYNAKQVQRNGYWGLSRFYRKTE